MVSPASWLRLAVMLVTVTFASAQVRKPCFLAVVDADGKAVANAEVTVFWRHGAMAPGADDVIHLVADARGRCRPELVPGRLYTVFAIGPVAADGSRAVSDKQARVIAGSVLDITLDYRWHARSIRVDGAAECVGRDEVEVLFGPCSVPTLATVLRVKNGRALLPPAPYGDGWVGARAVGGSVQQVHLVTSWGEDPVVSFQPCTPLLLAATGPDGEPVRDVVAHGPAHGWPGDGVVLQRWLPARTAFSVAKVDGGVTLPSYRSSRFAPWAAVSAPGFGPTYVALRPPSIYDVDSPVTVALRKVDELRLPVRGLRQGEAMSASLQLVVGSRARLGLSPVIAHLHMNAVDGQLLARLPAEIVTSQLIARMTPHLGTSRPRTLVMPLNPGKPSYSAVRLDKLRSLQLSVVGPDGGVAPGAEVGVMGLLDIKREPESGLICVHSVTDMAGRSDFVFGAGAWVIYASDGLCHGVMILGHSDAGGPQQLQMQKVPTTRLRVLDTECRPVRGASLEVHSRSRRARRQQANNELHWARLAFGWYVTSGMVGTARSDADGVMLVPVPDWVAGHGTYVVRAGERKSDEVNIEAGGDVVVR